MRTPQRAVDLWSQAGPLTIGATLFVRREDGGVLSVADAASPRLVERELENVSRARASS